MESFCSQYSLYLSCLLQFVLYSTTFTKNWCSIQKFMTVQTVHNSQATMYFFSTKQSGKVPNRSGPQKCHSNLWTVLKLIARFHFLAWIYTIFCADTYLFCGLMLWFMMLMSWFNVMIQCNGSCCGLYLSLMSWFMP